MTDQEFEQEPSETALFAALRRTIAHKEYKNKKFGPDNLAEYFLPFQLRFFLKFNRIRENTKERLNGFLPGLNEYMIARTAHFDTLFLDALTSDTPQIVLLGAGYDSRAYRFAKLIQSTKIFELDMAPTQGRKKSCIKKAKIPVPQQVAFVPINFNQESLKSVLENAGYQKHLKTLFVWEGVSYYLDADSVETTLDFVGQSSPPESLIGFDYTVPLTEATREKYYGAQEFAQTMEARHASEALTFSIADADLDDFVEQRSLQLVEHLDHREIERRYLLDAQGALIGPITGHFRFATASVGNKSKKEKEV